MVANFKTNKLSPGPGFEYGSLVRRAGALPTDLPNHTTRQRTVLVRETYCNIVYHFRCLTVPLAVAVNLTILFLSVKLHPMLIHDLSFVEIFV